MVIQVCLIPLSEHAYLFYLFKIYFKIWHVVDFGGFPDGSAVKNSPANAGDLGLIPGLEDPLEKEMTTHSSILAWKIPWTEEPGRP